MRSMPTSRTTTVSPLHGETKLSSIEPWDEVESGGVFLIDTPGLDEAGGYEILATCTGTCAIPNAPPVVTDPGAQESAEGRAGLADVLRDLLAGFDELFGAPYPYSLALIQAPTDDADRPFVARGS